MIVTYFTILLTIKILLQLDSIPHR